MCDPDAGLPPNDAAAASDASVGTDAAGVEDGGQDAAPLDLDASMSDAALLDAPLDIDAGGDDAADPILPDAAIDPDAFVTLDVGTTDAWSSSGDAGLDGGAPPPPPCSPARFAVDWTDPTTRPDALATGDVDGDGRSEVAVGYLDGTVRVARLAGTWSFTQTIPGAAQVAGLRWGDADADGDQDLVVAHYSGGRVRVLRNDAGTLAVAWTSPSGADHGRPAWGDYDSDGDLDVAVPVGSGGRSQLYRNDGGLSFSPAWTAPESGHAIHAEWADLDGDRDPDLLIGMDTRVSPAGAASVIAYRNDAGVLTRAWSSTGTGAGYAVSVADHDGDLDLDLAVADFTGAVRLYRNDGALTFSPGTVWTGCTPHNVSWSGDGRVAAPSLAVYCQGGSLRVLSVAGGTLDERWSSLETGSFGWVAWGEVDGDRVLDLASVDPTGNATRVYRGACGSTALRLDGMGDGVVLPRNPAFGSVGTRFTIEAWFRPTSADVQDYAVLFNRRGDNGDYRLMYSVADDGHVRFEVFVDGASSSAGLVSVATTVPPATGVWHHVAGVVDGRAVRLYVDGLLQGSATAPADVTWRPDDPRATLHGEYAVFLGHTRSPGDGGAPLVSRFAGDLDDVRVSRVARYSGASFMLPATFTSDADTVGLWAFEEPSGSTAEDSGASGSLDGTIDGAVRVPGAR